MQEQTWQHNHRRRRCKTASLLGVTLGLVAGMAFSAQAKTHDVQMTAVETDIVIDGGGEKYAAWTFNGQFPGPVVRVTEGDTINFTLTNPATNKNPHAMDFHAAEIDFLKNYRAVNAGESISFTFVAKKPGVFFYHCGAPPMIQHVARGMFGAIIVDPKDAKVWPKADREYVLVDVIAITNKPASPITFYSRANLIVESRNMLFTNSFAAISVLINAIATACAVKDKVRAKKILKESGEIAISQNLIISGS